MTPEAAMRLALAQARRASGRTFPNPPVGAVVVRGERVLGRGATRPAGQAHAEVVAIRAAVRRHGERAVRGATLAVTLEPCSHVGRTAPCADLIVASGIRRVHAGHRDPFPKVAGRGLRRLRRAGLEVTLGVLEAECREQHRGFVCVCERGRPFVSLKLASTLDGRIATASGESRWITGASARAAVHRLRARSDAVLVGSGTALADDPELTVRRGERVIRTPIRVLVDSGLRVPLRSKLYTGALPRTRGAARAAAGGEPPGGAARTWVLCARATTAAQAARRLRVESTGARVFAVPRKRRQLDLARAMAQLAEAGLTEVLVEGGGGLAATLLREDLVDEVHWFVAPKLLGGDARAALGPLGARRLADAIQLAAVRTRRVGEDLHVQGRVVQGRVARGAARP